MACNFDDADITLQYGISTAGLSCSPVFPNEINTLKENNPYSFNLFPNPCNGNFTLLKRTVSSNALIKIFSLQGDIVYAASLNDSKLNEVFETNLQAGVYFISIKSANGELVNQKLIIAK